MSYPKGLDEYTEDELQAELDRRANLQSCGVCDYCGRAPDTPACKFPERHNAGAPLIPGPQVPPT